MTVEKGPRQITASYIISWAFGVLFVFWGIYILQNANYASGIFVLACSLLLVPPSRKFVEDKLNVQFSGGLVVLLIFVGFIFLTVVFDSPSPSTSTTQLIEIKEMINAQNEIGEVTSTPNETCPDMASNTENYKFKWADNMDGNQMLWLEADFIGLAQFSDAWTLTNPPDVSRYFSDNFVCRPGSQAGQSTNKLYCESTIYYKPRLIKNTIDEEGNITKSDYTYLESFIFDITGKDIENNVDLDTLVLESITCSEDSF